MTPEGLRAEWSLAYRKRIVHLEAELTAAEDKLRRIAELSTFSADVPCIGFDGERYIPSAAIRAVIEETP